MNKEAEKGSWDEFEDKEKKVEDQSDKKRLPFVKFDKPGDYTFRLVGGYVKFLRYWAPFSSKDRVITHKDYLNEDPVYKAGFYPKETYAIHVIDRADGKLKILEKGRSIFKEFAKYRTINDIDPAGKNGPDFVITVEIPKGQRKSTKYTVTAKAKPAPFTQEEATMIMANHITLTEMYKSTSLEKIKELWSALPDEAKTPPPKKSQDNVDKSSKNDVHDESKNDKSETVKTTAESDPEGEDLFENSDENAGDSASLF